MGQTPGVFCAGAVVWLCLGVSIPARAAVETIYVVPGSHLDVGFTDLPSRVLEHRIAVIDSAIDAAQSDPAFHWTEDGAWAFAGWLERHLHDTPRLRIVRHLLENGQLSIGATWVIPHAAVFWEFLDLLTTHCDQLQQLLGYRPPVALLNDAPSYPEALVDALAAQGIRYALIGANMTFSRPLPSHLVRTPFWWESARGARLLVYIDPDSYVAAHSRWAIDPDLARFFNPQLFPPDRGTLETMQNGIRRMLGETSAQFDALVVQHSLDNWSDVNARKLPGFVKQWNATGQLPRLVLASAQDYFRHIEERYGAVLPVLRGEWGGQWDDTRGACPVWTWRLRQAMRAAGKDAPVKMKLALATAMDHGLGLGPGWSGMFTETQTIKHAHEQEGIFKRAVKWVLGP